MLHAPPRVPFIVNGLGVGRLFPQRCSDSEKYDTADFTDLVSLLSETADTPERKEREDRVVLENCAEREPGEMWLPLAVVGLEFPETSATSPSEQQPPHMPTGACCRALAGGAALDEMALGGIYRERGEFVAKRTVADGEIPARQLMMVPGNDSFGDWTFPTRRAGCL